MAYVQFLVLCLIWSASFILMKKAYLAFGPMTIASWRALSGAALLGVIWWLARRPGTRAWPLGKKDLLPLLVPGVLGFAYPYVMQPHLVGKYQDSGYFGMMVALVPLGTIVVSVPMLGVWPTWRQLIGVLLGLGCMMLLAEDGQGRGVLWYDLILALSVPAMYAVCNTFIKKRFGRVSPLALSSSALVVAGLTMLPASLAMEEVKPATPGQLTLAISALAVLGLVGTGLAMFMLYRLIQSHGPLFAGMTAYLIPLGALVWGWLDGERLTLMQVIAMGGIFLGVALVQWPARPKAAFRGVRTADG